MKQIQLTQGYVAKVSDKDFARVNRFKWHAVVFRRPDGSIKNVYAVGDVRMHRFILGVTDPQVEVDHRDHDGLNNVRRNLRRATQGQNRHNMRKIRGVSKYKGVYWHKSSGKWVAQIAIHDRRLYLGGFAAERAAALAYDVAARKYHGRFALTNF